MLVRLADILPHNLAFLYVLVASKCLCPGRAKSHTRTDTKKNKKLWKRKAVQQCDYGHDAHLQFPVNPCVCDYASGLLSLHVVTSQLQLWLRTQALEIQPSEPLNCSMRSVLLHNCERAGGAVRQ